MWIQGALRDFDMLWGLMTPDNRQRLVAALLDGVEVNEAARACELKLSLLTEAA